MKKETTSANAAGFELMASIKRTTDAFSEIPPVRWCDHSGNKKLCTCRTRVLLEKIKSQQIGDLHAHHGTKT